ncbi:MAG: hypothetical protein GXY58_18430 [Planctomycetaceae bacterium]|nr:hypothetical protein [Planctomycetaceae bacterium]
MRQFSIQPVPVHGRGSLHACILLLASLLTLPLSAPGTAAGQPSGQEAAGATERQREVMAWFDKYLTDTDLMLPGTADKLRSAVAQMSPSQLDRWLTQTNQLRVYVESLEWQATKKWLHGFLKVQAIYSEKELQEFRQKLFEADADQLLTMLQQIQAKHESIVWMHQAAGKMRQADLQGRNTAVARRADAGSAARTAARRDVPLFGNASQGRSVRKPDSGYRVPRPLINSRTVAAWEVWRNAW